MSIEESSREYYLHRTLCTVLDEMRRCYHTRNFAPLLSLIEEAQIMGNRMEAALVEQKDIVSMDEEWHRLKAEIKKLRTEARGLDGHVTGAG